MNGEDTGTRPSSKPPRGRPKGSVTMKPDGTSRPARKRYDRPKPPEPVPETVWCVIHVHRYNAEVTVCRTEDAAWRAVADLIIARLMDVKDKDLRAELRELAATATVPSRKSLWAHWNAWQAQEVHWPEEITVAERPVA